MRQNHSENLRYGITFCADLLLGRGLDVPLCSVRSSKQVRTSLKRCCDYFISLSVKNSINTQIKISGIGDNIVSEIYATFILRVGRSE